MKAAEMLGRAGALALVIGLAGCGGGGVSSTPAPVVPAPTPTPTPAPTPTPTPTNYDTSEYRRSDGPSLHGAITAWQSGASGVGATIAIIDSGIDTANTEFAGRIAATSRDVVGFRSLSNAEDDHGTQVALVAAAARNDSGVMGMAWNATVQMLRADTPGTCNASDGCTFADGNIAAGIDAAVSAGARVINLSLGGDPANAALRTSIARAASSGAVIVVSAGNDGDSTSAGVDPTNPDPFAASVLQAGGANVIIVGSVDDAGVISDFSNRPGTSAASVLMALGERVCCVYEGSVPKTTTGAEGTFVTVVSGTSFAAPQVSGAVALLADAFPSLTGAQIVDLLLRSARDAGMTGTDAIYGRGLLDIARAFSPQGSTSLAGTQVGVSLGALSGTTSAAMGDAVSGTSLGTVMLDGYRRAYRVDLASGLRASSARQPLLEALSGSGRAVSLDVSGLALAFTVDRRFGALSLRLAPQEHVQARVMSSSLVARLGRATSLAMGRNVAGDSLARRLGPIDELSFLLPGTERPFVARPEGALALRHRFGSLDLTFSAERSLLWRAEPLRERRDDRVNRFALQFAGGNTALQWRLGLEAIREHRTVLGARFAEVMGGGGATSFAVSPAMTWQPAMGWSFGANAGYGMTRIDRSAVSPGGSLLRTSTWAVHAARTGILAGDDRLALRLSQPLRVESGGLQLDLPVAWDYASQTAAIARVPLSLAPHGREIDTELAWSARTSSGFLSTSLFLRREPGHVAGAPADAGIALRWSSDF